MRREIRRLPTIKSTLQRKRATTALRRILDSIADCRSAAIQFQRGGAGRIDSGAAAVYFMDEGSGNTLLDSAPTTPALPLAFDPAKVGRLSAQPGIVVNTVDGLARSATSAIKIIQTIQNSRRFSLEFWTTPDTITSTANEQLLSLASGTQSSQTNLILAKQGAKLTLTLRRVLDGRNRLVSTSLGNIITTASVPHHIVVTYDGLGLRVFVDGSLRGESSLVDASFTPWNLQSVLRVGNGVTVRNPVLGTIHLLAIFPRALSPNEVVANFGAGYTTPTSSSSSSSSMVSSSSSSQISSAASSSLTSSSSNAQSSSAISSAGGSSSNTSSGVTGSDIFYDDPLMVNYKTGFDLKISGRRDVHYVVEDNFYNPKLTDTKKIYIRADALLKFIDNGRSRQLGILRCEIDNYLNFQRGKWAPYPDATNLLPSFQDRIVRFSDLSYPFNAQQRVLGSIGAQPGALITDKFNYHHFGLRTQAGSEVHKLACGKDYYSAGTGGGNYAHWAGEGKLIDLVVAPLEPAIQFKSTDSTGQFFTTVLWPHHTLKTNPQTTSLSGNVEIRLTNIMSDEPVRYSLDNGPFQIYSGPISANSIADGPHTLAYFYRSDVIAFRQLIKNPPFPSAAENHGLVAFGSQAAFDAARARLLAPTGFSSEQYRYRKSWGSGLTPVETALFQGNREYVQWSDALFHSLVVAVEGLNAETLDFARAAKLEIMDSLLNLDFVGSNLGAQFNPRPLDFWNNSIEYGVYGYYDMNHLVTLALGYDLLIPKFNSSIHPLGITPYDDLFIRDVIANRVFETTKLTGNYSEFASDYWTHNGYQSGWGDMPHMVAALVGALTIPTYDGAYGTSGMDGRIATRVSEPFPQQPVTWKELFVTRSSDFSAIRGYPNQDLLFNFYDGGLITDSSNPTGAGHFYGRNVYFGSQLNGHCFQIYANLMKLHFPALNSRLANLELAFDHATDGTLRCASGAACSASDPATFQDAQLLLINARFRQNTIAVNLAQEAWNLIRAHTPTLNPTADPGDPFKLDYLQYANAGLGLLFFDESAIIP